MDKKQIIAETREIIQDYSRENHRQTADLLESLWLKGDVTKSSGLVKKEQREKLKFKGIQLDVLKSMGKEIGKTIKNVDDFLPLAETLWNNYGREGRIVSAVILGKIVGSDPEKIVPVCKKLVKTAISWEDCDNMVEGIEPLIRKEPETYLEWLYLWLQDENKWVRRCCITVIGRLPMKRPEYTSQCLNMIVPCLTDDDKDVQRAVSFAIRMGARGDIQAVYTFVRTHAGGLNPGKIWVFSDVIRSMTKKFIPAFRSLLPVYEEWLHTVDNPQSKRRLHSAVSVLEADLNG